MVLFGKQNDLDIVYTPAVNADGGKDNIPEDILFDRPLVELTENRDNTGSILFSVGSTPDPENYSKFDKNLRVESTRIKFPGTNTHTIPAQCSHLMGVIKTIIDFEARNSELFKDKTALLTVRQFNVAAGGQQNNISWHRDRVGRLYDDEPEYPLTDHIYIVSDVNPALVQMRTMAGASNALTSGKAEKDKDYRRADPYEIILMTNYCHHAPGKMEEEGVRTFIQLIYTSPSYEDLAKRKNTPSAPAP